MKVLRSRLYEIELQRQQSEIASDRRGQVGTGERSEKIRTYNFPQNRITESPHRLHDPPAARGPGRRSGGPRRDRRHPLPVREAEVGKKGGAGVTGPRAGPTGPCPWSTGWRERGTASRAQASPRTQRRSTPSPCPAYARVGSRGLARSPPRPRAPELRGAVRAAGRAPAAARAGLVHHPAPRVLGTRLRRRPRGADAAPGDRADRRGRGRAARRSPGAPLRIADVGTGSGCLAVALALEFERAAVTAIDISPAALAVARRNAATHGVAGRIAWIEGTFGDWLAGSSTEDGGGLDLLVANLPYVPTGDLGSLPPRSASTNLGSRWTEAPTASIRCVICCVRRRPGSTPARGSSSRWERVRPTRFATSWPRRAESNCSTSVPTSRAFREPP